MMRLNTLKRMSWGDHIIHLFFHGILILVMLLCAYPIWYVLVASISDPTYINSGALILWPRGIQWDAYVYVFGKSELWSGYTNTILYTCAGTFFGLILCLPCGYALSRRDLPGRSIIMALFVFTMYFGGGMIPTYIVASTLNLINTRWILIMFGSISVYNIILIRTFFLSSLPDEMREAAFIDGCSNSRFFLRFALPLSKAIIAVIALYIAVGHWNSYYTALVYTTERKIQPLQIYLRRMLLISIDNESTADPDEAAKITQLVQVIRYAVIVVSSLPIMCLYPFLQKYFVQGVMIGSLKG